MEALSSEWEAVAEELGWGAAVGPPAWERHWSTAGPHPLTGLGWLLGTPTSAPLLDMSPHASSETQGQWGPSPPVRG